MSLFITQGNLLLPLDTDLDLSTATVAKILWKNPIGRKGEWTGTVVGDSIQYQLSNSSITVPGFWEFQAFATIGGLDSYGDIVRIEFKKPLNQ